MISTRKIFILVGVIILILLAAVFFANQRQSPEAAKTLPSTETTSVSVQVNSSPIVTANKSDSA
jgi:regulatory protein YycI of two-component signal transduction system YycFG